MERTGIEPAFSPRSTIKLPRVVGVITSDYHYCGSDSSHILLSVSVSPVPGFEPVSLVVFLVFFGRASKTLTDSTYECYPRN